MEEKDLRELLAEVRDGSMDVDDALLRLRMKPFEDLGYAKVDTQRGVRTGVAEAIFGESKTAEQIAGIARSMRDSGQKTIIVTRLDAEKAEKVLSLLAADIKSGPAASGAVSTAMDENHEGQLAWHYWQDGRIAVIGQMPEKDGIGKILVITAGTSDVPVAEEAAVTAEALGNEVVRVYDAGVAGLHRLLSHMKDIMGATVIIAIAGMEGALPAVVTGLADCPVIAVPTSVGYGTSFHGMSALLSMLNCCASGMCVENIDNGFGAAYFASMINHLKGVRY